MCLTFYIFNVDTQISKSVKPKYAVHTTEAFYTFAPHRGGGFESQCFSGLWHWTTGEGKNITNVREWHVVKNSVRDCVLFMTIVTVHVLSSLNKV